MTQLVLASTSVFRRQLLEKLQLPFVCDAPDTDETAFENETAEALVQRLAQAKARAVADNHGDALIIGSDQVATLDGQIIGKPLTHQNAVQQLRNSSGRSLTFFTGLCLYNSSTGEQQTICEPFKVHFRKLCDEQIERYLTTEKPYQCAGSFKSEGYGISLFEKLEGDDPNSLIGLPLIRLVAMLQRQGIAVP
ncbi:Maf family protein [Motiliproteus sp.]|uniref:Maf family protein n=1 Tax=Motiliproteus sp. TaxID=1898955 RepID=UPI003BAAD570